MEITIFESITTESALVALEEESKKYEGLYVDMNNPPERKYVKDQASNIKSILKRLDRARIDVARDYKLRVEKEAEAIKERLEAANLPFTDLIDEWQAERDQILKEKKAREDAKALKLQIEADHEMALLMDFQETSERKAREVAKLQYEAQLKEEAANQAVEAEREKQELARQKFKEEEAKRAANVEHVRQINGNALKALANINGIDEELAREIVKSIVRKEIPNVSINY